MKAIIELDETLNYSDLAFINEVIILVNFYKDLGLKDVFAKLNRFKDSRFSINLNRTSINILKDETLIVKIK